ncbi:unnamed protein product [Schistosoma turkestanicum]|nr:unnamed protein product [Schistosoma turkestanicum]
MATATKPDTKRSYSSWFENLNVEKKVVEDSRNQSFNNRQLVKETIIDADISSAFDKFQTNTHLSDRIWTVRQWRDNLINRLNQLKQKASQLKAAQHELEEFMVKLNDSIDVNIECLTHLDHRRDDENIIDPIFVELNKEHDLLKQLHTDLQNQIDESVRLLVEMNDVQKFFYSDILNKNDAVHIDTNVFNMNENSSCVSYKPFCERLPENPMDLQTWENISAEALENAENVIDKANELIHRMHNNLHKAINNMASKASQVNNALNSRIYDTQKAIGEIEYQIKCTENEKDELLKEIKHLEDTIRAKKASLKLAETRLEKRHDRLGNENIQDNPHLCLLEEISNLRKSIDLLEGRLANSRGILQDLQHKISQLSDDLQHKRNSLQIYEEIHNIRKRLDYAKTIDGGVNSSSINSSTTLTTCPMIPNGIVRESVVF